MSCLFTPQTQRVTARSNFQRVAAQGAAQNPHGNAWNESKRQQSTRLLTIAEDGDDSGAAAIRQFIEPYIACQSVFPDYT